MIMDIRERLVKAKYNNLDLFDYYKSIGCTDNQSLVLSLYSYGRNFYWYNDLKAFQFYYDLYMKDKDRKESLCDFIANKILSVEGVSLDKALENAKEYKEFLEEEEGFQVVEKEKEFLIVYLVHLKKQKVLIIV